MKKYYRDQKKWRNNMIDIKLIRENKDLVKENIKKKFQNQKLPLVDEVEALDIEYRNYKKQGDDLRACLRFIKMVKLLKI